MVSLYHHNGSVEETVAERLVGRCRNQVVERSKGTIAILTRFCIGMTSVIQYLVFTTDGRSLTLVQIGIHKYLMPLLAPSVIRKSTFSMKFL